MAQAGTDIEGKLDLVKILGEHVMNDSGEMIPTKDLMSKQVVGLYFSAHWCPPCRAFTPVLVNCYKTLKKDGKDFEIVFISWDENEEKFKQYFHSMGWLALPFQDRSRVEAISGLLKVSGIPNLILIDPGKGEIITREGRAAISTLGSNGFPWNGFQPSSSCSIQ